jgi:hypothetical protein
MKKCTRCKKELTESNFHKNNTKKDKLSNRCKECTNITTREWQHKNRERHNNNQKKQKINRTNKGLCRYCLNEKLPNSTRCEKHWFEDISVHHFGTTNFGTFLKELAQKQNFKCFYSDKELIPAFNMSLDHIISNFDNPTKKEDISNVQWVTKDMNLIKNKLSHENFIELCDYISKKFNKK